MKRAAVFGALAVMALLGAWQASAAQPEATAPAPVFEAREEARCEGALWSSAEETVLASEAKCEDFGFFDSGKKKECDESCKKGKKCVKKQVCGDGPCPDPGYCWKCSN